MSEQAIRYLNENRNSYSRDILKDELLRAGYDPADVLQSLAVVFGQESKATEDKSILVQDSVIHQSQKEKAKDFLIGLVLPLMAIIPVPLGGIVLSILIYVACVISIVILWKTRRFLAYGVLVHLLALILLAVSIISILIL